MKQPTQIVAKVDYIGRGAVVTVPQSIEPWHTRCLREQLLWLLNERIEHLVIDFTPTLSCSSEMREVLERVHTRTQARGIGLSLVLSAESPAAKALEQTGLPRLLRTYADRAEAEGRLQESAAPPESAGSAVPTPRGGGPVARAS
ncbi:STAS domain-containing protein [Streptomonospora litoralis]|uniref:STAS domain-containing protein n=1 Tax=Streptomonospora litoralis TaxID=2498135 RepID=A0A4P6Q7B9_9ACTN|nr:STAS domain-containing protein [Streptomonospora litoralis]QBI56688.1 hypothetical protein EKD16_24730 [Streptomonospora litoralis]